jgi:hypothetical protein
MKKKVLFALIALMSFVTSWATGPAVSAGDFLVTLSNQYVAVTAQPEVSSITKGGNPVTNYAVQGVFDANKTKVLATQTPGEYYLGIKVTEETSKTMLYVPFTVGKVVNYSRVNDETTFNAAMAENGAYALYYEQYPWCDVVYTGGAAPILLYPGQTINELGQVVGQAFDPIGEDRVGDAEDWYDDLHDDLGEQVESRLWEITGARTDSPNKDNIAFSFANNDNAGAFGQISSWQIILTYEGNSIAPWTAAFGPSAKQYGLASVERDIADENLEANPNGFGIAYDDFDEDKLQVLMVPNLQSTAPLQAQAVPVQNVQPEVDFTESFEYDGTVQKPNFSDGGDSYVMVGEDQLEEGVDYEVVYENANSTTVGSYNFTINFIGGYEAPSITRSYRINGHTLAINLAYVYKNYGEADPVHPSVDNFEIEGGLVGDDSKEDIAQWLVIKRATGKEGEDVGQYEYYYDFTPEYYTECQYKINPLQTTSNLIIRPRPLTIVVTPETATKKYNGAEPTYKYVVNEGLKGQLAEADKDKATGTPGENDIISSISREPGETVGQYEFTATSKNYTVTVDNGFEITPTDQTGGVTVTFDPASYVYNGLAQTPEPIVKDGNTVLVAGEDYTIVDYKDNKDVGTATCNIQLQGSYVATGAASKKNGTFTITKAPLTIAAQSYTTVPDAFEIVYDGFVNGETADVLAETYQDAPGTTKPYFVKPTGVTKGDAIEQDVYPLIVNQTGVSAINYDITFVNGLLALNEKPIIYVRPENKTQVYGEEEKELTVKAYSDWLQTEVSTDPLFILGKPVYKISREEGTNVGNYDIDLDGPTVLRDCNVVYLPNPDGYQITRKELILKAINATKVYGEEDPVFDALVYDGEKAWTREQMDAVGIINNGPNNTGYYVGCGTWRNGRWNHGENVGEYPITVGLHSRSYDNGNYYITGTQNGTFTITKAAVTITVEDETKQFGQPDPVFTVMITDANKEEVSEAFYQELAPYYVVERTEAEATREQIGNTHVINVHAPKVDGNDFKPANFDITFKNGLLTITKAQMRVEAKDQWINYAGSINPYDVTIYLPGQRTLRWNKSGMNGLTDEQKAENDEIKSLIELSVLEGKNKIGANEDAYKLTVKESATYELAPDTEIDGVTVPGFDNGWLTVYPLTEIPLDMENLAQVLEDHKGLEGITFIMPARKMIHDEWYAWVFPFDVQPSTLFGRMWGYGAAETLDAAKSQNGNVVFALQVYNKIKANTPFIAKIERDIDADEMKEIRITGKTIPADFSYTEARPATVAEDGGVKFVGLYEDYTGPQPNQLYLAATKNKPTREFYPGGPKSANVTLVQTNAYLEFPTAEAAAKARIFIEEEDGTFTAINGVAAEADAAVAGEGWYTISGVKLNAQPTEKGIYIFNGKKVAIQ